MGLIRSLVLLVAVLVLVSTPFWNMATPAYASDTSIVMSTDSSLVPTATAVAATIDQSTFVSQATVQHQVTNFATVGFEQINRFISETTAFLSTAALVVIALAIGPARFFGTTNRFTPKGGRNFANWLNTMGTATTEDRGGLRRWRILLMTGIATFLATITQMTAGLFRPPVQSSAVSFA